MNSLNVRRAVIWTVSMAIGFFLTFLLVIGPLETDISTYSIKYFVLTAISLGCFFLIWGDYLLGTQILPD
jgi:hypothetical protein